MKVFVTGGTGFIGSHLVDYLTEDPGFSDIRCLIRGDKKWLSKKPVQIIRGDMYNLPALKEGIRGTDVVFHLAAHTKAKSMHAFERLNVDAAENLVRMCIRQGIKHVVVLSSLAAAGPSFSKPIDENDPLMPISMYGESKKMMEQRIQQMDLQKTRVTVIRPPAVYGPRDTQIYTIFKIASFGIFPIIRNETEIKLSLIYVKDVVQALIKSLSLDKPGFHPYFVAGKKDYTWPEIKAAAEKALQKKTVQLPLSSNWLKKTAHVVEKAGGLLGIYPDFNREKAHEMVMEWTCSTKKAEADFNFSPQYSLTQGFETTIAWYKRNHWL